MKHEEQMVVTALQSVQNLLAAIKANPEKYLEHMDAIFEISYDAGICNDFVKQEFAHPTKELWFNNCDTAAMQAKIKIAGL